MEATTKINCEKCVKYANLKWIACPKCGVNFAALQDSKCDDTHTPYEIPEAVKRSEVMKSLISLSGPYIAHETLCSWAMVWQSWNTIIGMNITTKLEEPIWRLLEQKMAAEHNVILGGMILAKGFALSDKLSGEKLNYLETVLNHTTTKIFVATVAGKPYIIKNYNSGESRQPAGLSNFDPTFYTLLFTEEEIEDAFEVLQGKNWLFDGLHCKKYDDSRRIFNNCYCFNKFYGTYRDMIKKAELKKFINGDRIC
jgi:hypothetical protein